MDENGGSANEVARRNIATMRTFFSVLKSLGSKQRLLFVTGVSKFALAGLFSGANNIQDLTLDKRAKSYTKLLGYTREEIRQYFDSRLLLMPKNRHEAAVEAESEQKHKEAVLAEIMKLYNGYSWGDPASSGTVANPYAVSSAFASLDYDNGWITQGSSGWAFQLVRKSLAQNDLPFDPNQTYSSSILDTIELDTEGRHSINLTSLLFQTGYLTITEYLPNGQYKLNFPNAEIREYYLGKLLSFLYDTKTSFTQNALSNAAQLALRRGRVKECFAYIDLHIASLSGQKNKRGATNSKFVKNEVFYNVIITTYLSVILPGCNVIDGHQGIGGEADVVVVLDEVRKVFVVELKVVNEGSSDESKKKKMETKKKKHEAKAREAIDQIDEKQYAVSLTAKYPQYDFYCVRVTVDASRTRLGTVEYRPSTSSAEPLDTTEGCYEDVLRAIVARG